MKWEELWITKGKKEMAKKSYRYVQLVPEVGPKPAKPYYVKKPNRGLKAGDKLRLRKYNPTTMKHEWYTEKKMPSHSK